MINKKEELAEYILKNLVFTTLFAVFCFYGISLIILPKIQDFRSKQEAFEQEQFFETKLKERNQNKQLQIQEKQNKNNALLLSLQQEITPETIQAIAQDFIEVESITEHKSQIQGVFKEITFSIKGKSYGTKALFNFIKKIDKLYPNTTFSLPLTMTKQDVLTNTLDVNLFLKVTKLNKQPQQ